MPKEINEIPVCSDTPKAPYFWKVFFSCCDLLCFFSSVLLTLPPVVTVTLLGSWWPWQFPKGAVVPRSLVVQDWTWALALPARLSSAAAQPCCTAWHGCLCSHLLCEQCLLFFFFSFIFISWRLIHNIAVGFVIHWHESAMELHVFPIPIPPPTSLSTRFLWVFPVHQAWALVSCIPPGLVICFTLDNIHGSMLFSQNIPPSPSPTKSKSLFYKSVSFFLFYI